MAPERFTGGEVTYRADIYALACVLSECLTGSPPYGADTVERLVAAHLLEPAPRPSQLRPETVPAAVDQVIAKGMAKNPEERYPSAGDLAAAAQDALTAAEQDQVTAIVQHSAEATVWASTIATSMAGARANYTGSGAAPETARGWETTPTPRARPALPPDVAAYPDFTGAGAANAQPKHKRILLGAAALLLAAAVIAATGYLVTHRPGSSTSASGQTVLPVTGIGFHLSPAGVALDTAGNVYITNESMYGRVLKLAPGSSTPMVLPFTGLYQAQGLAVGTDGAVCVTDFNNRVVKLNAGSNIQAVLPFTGLTAPWGIAVDNAGTVYVTDHDANTVVKLAAESNTPTELPFTDLDTPLAVAVDTGGKNVFVADRGNGRVVKLAAG